MLARGAFVSDCFAPLMACASLFRSRDEVSGIRKERDPIDKLKRITKELGWADDNSIKQMEKDVSCPREWWPI